METVIGRYIVREDDMHVWPSLRWTADDSHAVIQWDWPANMDIRIAMVYDCADETPDIYAFLRYSRPHVIVARELSASCKRLLTGAEQRYMVCPAQFGDNNTVIVHYSPNGMVTDVIYKKIKITYVIKYVPVKFSNYKRASIKITCGAAVPAARFDEIITRALRYGLYTGNRLVCRYPLDVPSISGDYFMYINKNEEVQLLVDESYKMILELERGAE